MLAPYKRERANIQIAAEQINSLELLASSSSLLAMFLKLGVAPLYTQEVFNKVSVMGFKQINSLKLPVKILLAMFLKLGVAPLHTQEVFNKVSLMGFKQINSLKLPVKILLAGSIKRHYLMSGVTSLVSFLGLSFLCL